MEKKKVYIAPGAVVLGDVFLEENVSIWYNATVRADSAPIKIGRGSNIQDNCVIHVSEGYPVVIGENVSVGHGAILHGCTIQDNVLVGMGAIIMNGCIVEKNSMVAAGALLTAGTRVPEGAVVMGSPAKIKRGISAKELEKNRHNAVHYVHMAEKNIG